LREKQIVATFQVKTMNVHITAFESYNEEDLSKILEILQEVKGPIEFNYLPYDRETYEFLDFNKKERFDQEDILHISKSIRHTNADIDYLVVLTSKGLDIPVVSLPKEKDWYSVFISKNIAVHISDRWKSVIKDKPYLAAAHQIVENVFQSLSHMELNSQIQLENVHQQAEICINDYCTEIWETRGKIRSGYICENCKERAINESGWAMVENIEKLLKKISDSITNNVQYIPKDEELKATVDDSGNLVIGKTPVKFGKSKIVKVNYIFHLVNHDNSFSFQDFKKEEVRTKFMELSSLLGHDMDEKNYKSHQKNLRCNHNRSNELMFDHFKSDLMTSHFKVVSECIAQDVHSYKVSSHKNNIEIPEYLQRFRVSK
jgi:hypothetical protein